MLALDRDALICDMAETYRIYDIKDVPAGMLAVLASGLGVNSRIRLKEQGLLAPWDTVLLATLVDMLSSKDDAVIASRFFIKKEKTRSETFRVFSSAEDFEKEKARILSGNSEQGK